MPYYHTVAITLKFTVDSSFAKGLGACTKFSVRLMSLLSEPLEQSENNQNRNEFLLRYS